jgi:hypothetical protein
MNSGKFFKVYMNNQAYKIFLDDVSIIYKVSLPKTPPITPYFNPSKSI